MSNNSHFRYPDREQILLCAEVDLNTVAPEGSVVKIIDEYVSMLDTSDIEKQYDLYAKNSEARHPKTLIKVALFGLCNNRFSLRQMEYDTRFNLAYKWLTGNESIDHSTMGKFLCLRKEYNPANCQ